MKKIARAAILIIAAGTGLASLTACGSDDGGDSGSKGKTIALLLPETKTTRYEAFDKPLFEAKVKELCSDCKVNYLNADQDASK
ncbi:MAG: ABC transporter substrate-binding protein, partial [Aeromicrobium sp.]